MRASPPKTSQSDCQPERARREQRFIRRGFVAAIGFVVLAAALWGFVSVRRALGGLEQARARGDTREAVRFERKRLNPLSKEGVRLFQSTRSVRAVTRFKD